jgi:hypothetical protein
MQGYVDVLKTAWDPATRTLSGTSKVVGGEIYQLVIATNGLKPGGCTAQGAKVEVMMKAPETDGIAVLSIAQADNGTVDWIVTF